MRVVLDTNVLLVAIAPNSIYRPIFDALLAKKYTLVLSNDILAEYEEIFSQKANPKVANLVLEALNNLTNVEKQHIFIKWSLIDADKDDNKFVDCAIAGNCHYIVTDDKHFKVLKERGNDFVSLIGINGFLALVEKL
jgi:uncharacterized protein